jgi:hypothetical protein
MSCGFFKAISEIFKFKQINFTLTEFIWNLEYFA